MCFYVKDDIIWYADEIKKFDKIPYSIGSHYSIQANLAELLHDETVLDIPLLFSGEENFDMFHDA